MYFHLELRGPHAGELPQVLGKSPDRLFEWELQGSMVRVLFPIHQPSRSRAAALFWPDPLSTVQRPNRTNRLEDYLNTRPFAANSLFCAALKVAFNGTISGHRQIPAELLARVHELEILVSPVVTYLSPDRIQSLFEPLGYAVKLTDAEAPRVEFNIRHPRVLELELSGQQRVGDALRHLLTLMPVLDADRNEHMGQSDVERLRRFGEGWLEKHPEQVFIVSRYLVYRRLVDTWLQSRGTKEQEEHPEDGYESSGEPLPIRHVTDSQRHQHLVDRLVSLPESPSRVLVMGCGDGRLLVELTSRGSFDAIMGVDPSASRLDKARRRLDRAMQYSHALRATPTRVELMVSAPGYHDRRLHEFDTVILNDALDHIEQARLPFIVLPILEQWRPRLVVMPLLGGERGGQGERESRGRSDYSRGQLNKLCTSLVSGRGYGFSIVGLSDEGNGASSDRVSEPRGPQSGERGPAERHERGGDKAAGLMAIFSRVGGNS